MSSFAPGRVDQVGVPGALRELLRRVRILEAVPPPTGGGAGYQFNAGVYAADNVGDWSLIEYTGNPASDFSQPSAALAGDVLLNSAGINAAAGLLLTDAPNNYDSNGNPVVNVEHYVSTGNLGGLGMTITVSDITASGSGGGGVVGGLVIFTDTAGTSGATSQGINVSSIIGAGGTGQATAVSGSAHTSTGPGPAIAGLFGALGGGTGEIDGVLATAQLNLGGVADAIAVSGTANNVGTGREIGGRFRADGGQTGANSLALLCQDHTSAAIFEVRDDGSVHIKTGTAIIADL